MSNELKMIIRRDPVDRDFYHIYALKPVSSRVLHWLVCSLHIDMLGEVIGDETFEALTEFEPGEDGWVDMNISLIRRD